MPDIFGKTQADFRMLDAMAKRKMLDAHNMQLKARGRVHNFDALPSSHNPIAVPLNDIEANAQAVHFVTNNLQAIQAQIEEQLYTDFRLDSFFPLITNIPEGARTYSYRVINKYGQGKFISNSGRDANNAQVSLQNVPYALEYGGIVPNWNLEDLRAAAFAGIALDTTTVSAGTEGCMDHIESVGLEGDATFGFTGLTNNADIPTTAAAKVISLMTADEMVAFIQSNVSFLIAQTQEVFSRVIRDGMTLYVPIAQETLLGDTKLATDASKSVWEYASVNNQWTRRTGKPLKMETVAEMAGAGAGATDRCLFGFNNDRVMEMAMPIQPRVIQTINTHYGVDTPMEYKVSGLNVKRPTAMLYVDSI